MYGWVNFQPDHGHGGSEHLRLHGYKYVDATGWRRRGRRYGRDRPKWTGRRDRRNGTLGTVWSEWPFRPKRREWSFRTKRPSGRNRRYGGIRSGRSEHGFPRDPHVLNGTHDNGQSKPLADSR